MRSLSHTVLHAIASAAGTGVFGLCPDVMTCPQRILYRYPAALHVKPGVQGGAVAVGLALVVVDEVIDVVVVVVEGSVDDVVDVVDVVVDNVDVVDVVGELVEEVVVMIAIEEVVVYEEVRVVKDDEVVTRVVVVVGQAFGV